MQHRIETRYPSLTYGPTWLRPGVGFINYSPGSKGHAEWAAGFDVPHPGDTDPLSLSWDVSRLSPSACNEMNGYKEATFEINGVKVYWWASNGEETAARCITTRGQPIAITAGAAVASDESLNTPRRRHHAYLLAKAVAYAARFPAR